MYFSALHDPARGLERCSADLRPTTPGQCGPRPTGEQKGFNVAHTPSCSRSRTRCAIPRLKPAGVSSRFTVGPDAAYVGPSIGALHPPPPSPSLSSCKASPGLEWRARGGVGGRRPQASTQAGTGRPAPSCPDPSPGLDTSGLVSPVPPLPRESQFLRLSPAHLAFGTWGLVSRYLAPGGGGGSSWGNRGTVY